jgi:hypothetical protein
MTMDVDRLIEFIIEEDTLFWREKRNFIQNIEDPNDLKYIYQNINDRVLLSQILERISDNEIDFFKEIALKDMYWNCRQIAISKIQDEVFLKDLFLKNYHKKDRFVELQFLCTQLKNQNLIFDMISNCANLDFCELLCEKLNDKYLLKLFYKESRLEIQKCIICNLNSIDHLLQLKMTANSEIIPFIIQKLESFEN